MHLVHWILWCFGPDGRNADGHLDGRHATFFLWEPVCSVYSLVVSQLDGWTMREISSEKFTLFNLTTDPPWVLPLATLSRCPSNLSAFGVDQLNAQRMFCAEMQGCPQGHDTARALLLTALMLMVERLVRILRTGGSRYRAGHLRA